MDLQCLSQCGSTYSCQNRSVPVEDCVWLGNRATMTQQPALIPAQVCSEWKTLSCLAALQVRCFMLGYLGSRPQLERGALGSAVIAGGVKVKFVTDLVLWEPKHGRKSVGGQARTLFCRSSGGTGVPSDCLPAGMDDRVGWRERAMGGRLRST